MEEINRWIEGRCDGNIRYPVLNPEFIDIFGGKKLDRSPLLECCGRYEGCYLYNGIIYENWVNWGFDCLFRLDREDLKFCHQDREGRVGETSKPCLMGECTDIIRDTLPPLIFIFLAVKPPLTRSNRPKNTETTGENINMTYTTEEKRTIAEIRHESKMDTLDLIARAEGEYNRATTTHKTTLDRKIAEYELKAKNSLKMAIETALADIRRDETTDEGDDDE